MEHSQRLKLREFSAGKLGKQRTALRRNAPEAWKCAGEVVGMLPKHGNARGKSWECSRSPEMRGGSRGNAPEARKCAGEAVGTLPKHGNAPWKPWERSQRLKMCREILGSIPEARKRAARGSGSAPESRKRIGEVTKILLKVESAPSKARKHF
ncbi:MAG: hypothetical protein J1E07_07180 [Treponema sp.]|nr:hypothetical protein [Treponema sp.]